MVPVKLVPPVHRTNPAAKGSKAVPALPPVTLPTRMARMTDAAPSTERHFYNTTRAFGRFGIRLFEPQIMPLPHWHGHIEGNFLINATMLYSVDGDAVLIPEGRMVLFWAGVPHQLTEVTATNTDIPRLCNVYMPVDAFLFMPHIAQLQVAMLSGAMVLLPTALCDISMIERWYSDYRSGDFERTEVVKMELNTLFRRALLGDLTFLRQPMAVMGQERAMSSAQIRHVVEMVRYIMEHLGAPMRNADVAAVTGLHQNYALSLFTRVMRLPMKQFVIRLRLLRARALLTESSMPITSVAEASGFTSISQFYQQFKASYGLPPNHLRGSYINKALR